MSKRRRFLFTRNRLDSAVRGPIQQARKKAAAEALLSERNLESVKSHNFPTFNNRSRDQSDPSLFTCRRPDLDIEREAPLVLDSVRAKRFHFRARVPSVHADRRFPSCIRSSRKPEYVVNAT